MNFQNKPILEKLYTGTVWISRLTIVNLLWILFTLLGFVVFGIGPASTAMAVVINKWVLGEEEFSTYRIFKDVYKRYFIKSNIIFLLLALIVFISSFNLYFTLIHKLPYMLVAIAGAFLLLSILIALIIFPTFVNTNNSITELFKTALVFTLSYPLNTLIILIAVVGLIIIQLFMPGLIFFFSGSSVTFITTLRIHKALERTQEIQQVQF